MLVHWQHLASQTPIKNTQTSKAENNAKRKRNNIIKCNNGLAEVKTATLVAYQCFTPQTLVKTREKTQNEQKRITANDTIS